jgi:flagellar biosynthesis regulator FlbT
MKIILDNRELFLIPTNSLNFSNFIHTLYYAVQDCVIEPEIVGRIQKEYLTELPENELKRDDRVVVEALKRIDAEVVDGKA